MGLLIDTGAAPIGPDRSGPFRTSSSGAIFARKPTSASCKHRKRIERANDMGKVGAGALKLNLMSAMWYDAF